MIPMFSDRGMYLINLPTAQTVLVRIVANPAGLKVGVDRYSADIFEAALLQVFADPVRETVADRNRTGIVALVQDLSVFLRIYRLEETIHRNTLFFLRKCSKFFISSDSVISMSPQTGI